MNTSSSLLRINNTSPPRSTNCVLGKWKRSHGFFIGSSSLNKVIAAKTCNRKRARPGNPNPSPASKVVQNDVVNDLQEHGLPHSCTQQSQLEGILALAISRALFDTDDAAGCELKASLANYYHEEFNQYLLDQYESHTVAENYLEIVLRASTHLIDELLQVCRGLGADDDDDTRKRWNQVITIAQQQLGLYLEPHIFWMGMAATTVPSEAATIISWVEQYLNLIPGLRTTSSCHWNKHVEELFDLYLERGVRLAMKECLATGLNLQGEDDVIETLKGKLVTGQPAEIAFLYHMQISVAKDNLPTHYLGRIVDVCNQKVREFVSQAMLQVGTDWKDMSVERLCSVINDAAKISDDCEERNEMYLEEDEHILTGKELCRDCMELALFATRQLCERIMMDMHQASEPILSMIGTSLWATSMDYDGASSAVQRTHATLSDYFADLVVWIPEYFFPKVLKHCLDLTLERYVEAFFGNTMVKGTRSAELAAAALRRDVQDFCGFWNNGVSAKYHGKVGFYTPQVLHQRFHLLLSFAFLLTPKFEPEDVKEEFETVLYELGADVGIPAVLHLVGLRKRHTEHESWQWHETISGVVRKLQSNNVEQGVCHHHKYKLPDLRNSRFLQNIQPPTPPRKNAPTKSRLSLIKEAACQVQLPISSRNKIADISVVSNSNDDDDNQRYLKQTGALVKKRNLQRLRWIAHERVRKLMRN